MATEDHDFEEVNHVHLFGKKLEWNQDQKGGVGTISTNSLHSIFEELKPILGTSENAKELYRLLSEAYLNNSDLASATRSLVNALFSKYGLVVLDADTKSLKQQAIPLIKKDVLEQANHTLIESTNAELSKIQAFVRPINFFYQQKGSRNRIELQGGEYVVLNTNLKFTKPELEKEIENNPELFSPNVLLRPLYKELLLPNLAMIGGGASLQFSNQPIFKFSNHLPIRCKQHEVQFDQLLLMYFYLCSLTYLRVCASARKSDFLLRGCIQ
jgi:uncharacterized protein YllA (UPF0747 family)